MKKTAFKLVIAVEGKAATAKRSSKTISSFINKIPCSKDFLQKPTQITNYVQREMKEYPMRKIQPSNRQIRFSQKIQKVVRKNEKQFNILMSKLEDRLSFLDLEEMNEMIKNMKKAQLIQYKNSIKRLQSNILYKLESSQGQKIDLEDHVKQAAENLIKQIVQLHSKKAYQIV